MDVWEISGKRDMGLDVEMFAASQECYSRFRTNEQKSEKPQTSQKKTLRELHTLQQTEHSFINLLPRWVVTASTRDYCCICYCSLTHHRSTPHRPLPIVCRYNRPSCKTTKN